MTTRATALCAESEELRTRMLEAVKGRRLVTVHERLDESIPVNAECVVLALDGSESPRQLEAFARQQAVERTPVILAADSPLVARVRRRLDPQAWIPVSRIESDLLSRIIGGICNVQCERMRDEVRKASLTPLVSKAILHALRASRTRPFRRTRELADAAGSSPTALNHALRTATAGSFTPHEFLSSLQVIRARELRDAGKSWTAAASAIEFSRRSVSRKSRAWLGYTLVDLDAWEAPSLLDRFERDYLRPLLGSI